MAKAKRVQLAEDPRYLAFADRYALDLTRFAVEVCGMAPTWQQREFFDSVERPGSRTSVSSGHGTGKTQASACVALWHLTCYRHSNTILSGPKLEVVLSGIRKYAADLHDAISKGPHAWIAEHIVIARKSFYVRGSQSQWWVQAKTAPAGKPEGMAGEHRKFLLWLIDEASGVDDGVMGVIMGSLTEDWNRISLMSQPTRAGGFFYDTHHRLSERSGGRWRAITMSSEDSPLVTPKFIEEKIEQYGGRDDPQYQIKVLGRFPEKLDGQLLARSELENCLSRPDVVAGRDQWGWAILVDVGAGEYRDKSVITVAKVSGYGQSHQPDARRMHITRFPVISNSIQPDQLEASVIRVAATLENPIIMLDAGGMGLLLYKRLEAAGVPGLVKVLWGRPCWSKLTKEAYFNQRAQAMVEFAKAARAGRVSIDPSSLNSVQREEFLSQHRVPFRFNDAAQYVIYPKGSKEWEGLPSPDILDTACFGFLESAQFIPVDSSTGDETEVRSALNALRAARAAAGKSTAATA